MRGGVGGWGWGGARRGRGEGAAAGRGRAVGRRHESVRAWAAPRSPFLCMITNSIQFYFQQPVEFRFGVTRCATEKIGSRAAARVGHGGGA